MAKVLSINLSDLKGVPKKPIDEGLFKVDHGLEGDAHASNWHRQVSLLAKESIEKMNITDDISMWFGKFAENITTEGIILYDISIGSKLKIGETIMEVTQIGKECHMGCAIRDIVGDCVMPREGIFAKVLKDGVIKTGDDIEIMDIN